MATGRGAVVVNSGVKRRGQRQWSASGSGSNLGHGFNKGGDTLRSNLGFSRPIVDLGVVVGGALAETEEERFGVGGVDSEGKRSGNS
ncbi:hypothetical protein ZIOFF_041523 [Zingiber officinale]|uniref:Uncharacterized protein n=1 Tax=Zingiber officinale TaxID=94328 RepID=A0A8J5L5Z1_ZINOF|nr:hypothetical protein ZIOFF_041523 [Zingiber officinale]